MDIITTVCVLFSTHKSRLYRIEAIKDTTINMFQYWFISTMEKSSIEHRSEFIYDSSDIAIRAAFKKLNTI